MRVMLAMFLALAMMGCTVSGVPVNDKDVKTASTKDDFGVKFLFEYKGVAVFRFYDQGEYRYFSIGDGKFQPQLQSREMTTSDGKTTTTRTEYWVDGVTK